MASLRNTFAGMLSAAASMLGEGREVDVYEVYRYRTICSSCGAEFDGEGVIPAHAMKAKERNDLEATFEKEFSSLASENGWGRVDGHTLCPLCITKQKAGVSLQIEQGNRESRNADFFCRAVDILNDAAHDGREDEK